MKAFYHSISTQSLAFILNFPFEELVESEPGGKFMVTKITSGSNRISISSEVKLNRNSFQSLKLRADELSTATAKFQASSLY